MPEDEPQAQDAAMSGEKLAQELETERQNEQLKGSAADLLARAHDLKERGLIDRFNAVSMTDRKGGQKIEVGDHSVAVEETVGRGGITETTSLVAGESGGNLIRRVDGPGGSSGFMYELEEARFGDAGLKGWSLDKEKLTHDDLGGPGVRKDPGMELHDLEGVTEVANGTAVEEATKNAAKLKETLDVVEQLDWTKAA